MAGNLRTVFLCTRAVLPGMIERRWGRIINISSQLAHQGAAEMAHYAPAKAGVIGLARSLAYEVAADGITVNAICPSPWTPSCSATSPKRGGRASPRSCPSSGPEQLKRSRRRRCCSPPTKAPPPSAPPSTRTAAT